MQEVQMEVEGGVEGDSAGEVEFESRNFNFH